MNIQPFPALDTATEAALRASIERFGVLVDVVVDQHGRILDGNHRARIAGELNVEYPVKVREVADDAEAEAIARTLNADRRHLTPEQRRPVVIALREEGHSLRAISGVVGVSVAQVQKDIHRSRCTPGVHLSEQTAGLDGKKYPATQPKSESVERRGFRKDRNQPFVVITQRHREVANGQKRRLEDGLSEITGICRGLRELDYGMVVAALTTEELNTWAAKAADLSRALREVKNNLVEVKANAA